MTDTSLCAIISFFVHTLAEYNACPIFYIRCLMTTLVISHVETQFRGTAEYHLVRMFNAVSSFISYVFAFKETIPFISMVSYLLRGFNNNSAL